MTQSVFYPKIDELPKVIPVFPLTGVLLLPIGKLPLNIFEPRYLAMVRDALADEQRIIGMVQPKKPDISDNDLQLFSKSMGVLTVIIIVLCFLYSSIVG